MPLARNSSGRLVTIEGNMGRISCAPFSCPGGLAATYGFLDYEDGDLVACGDGYCSYLDYEVPWDGTFQYVSDCLWRGDAEQIDLRFVGTMKPTLYLDTERSCPRWDVTVYCATYPDSSNIIWRGVKSSGNDPVGIYTRIDGCDITTAMSIVEIP